MWVYVLLNISIYGLVNTVGGNTTYVITLMQRIDMSRVNNVNTLVYSFNPVIAGSPNYQGIFNVCLQIRIDTRVLEPEPDSAKRGVFS